MEPSLIYPNWHAFLIHTPLGLLTAGVLIELFSFLWPRGTFRVAGRWMILLGALGMLPAAVSGVYALNDVVQINNPVTRGSWNDKLLATPITPEAFEALTKHVRLVSIATILFLVSVLGWVGSSDNWRRKLRIPLLIVMLIGLGAVSLGAYEGGEAVYQHGVAVVRPTVGQAQPGVQDVVAPYPGAGSNALVHNLLTVLPPRQTHMLLASITFALALVSLALSTRVITQGRKTPATLPSSPAVPSPANHPIPTPPHPTDAGPIALAPDSDDAVIQTQQTTGYAHPATPAIPARDVPSTASAAALPVGRFWLLTLLAAILTALLGHVVVGLITNQWSLAHTFHALGQFPRLLVHVICGASLIVLPILLAIASRWARQNGILLTVLGVLLVLAIGVQIWMGILLLYDGPRGPLTGFRPATAALATGSDAPAIQAHP